jgi:hypothetical protein
MYPKHFFERFWEGEQKNQLFVGIAFDDSVASRFTLIDKAVKSLNFENAFRVGLETEANSINDRIFDGIANSKMLLFDLSDDSRTNDINHNVIYELGIANAIREPFDIVLIRKKSNNKPKLPFDIQGLHINFFEDNLTEEFIKMIVESAFKNQKWHKSKRVRVAAESIDENGLSLMYSIGCRPKGFNHFHSNGWEAERKMSLLRLIDLGIVRFACVCYPDRKGFENAYHWTSFGYEVMEHLNIKQMSDEDFEKQPDYPDAVKHREQFYENKKKILGE